ncbi:unnamed protein product, partial [Oikopleura dioica]
QEGLQAWANDFGEPDPRCREVHDFECDDIDAVSDLCLSLDPNNVDRHSYFFHCSPYVDKTAAHIACLIDGCTDRSSLCGSLGSYAKQCLNSIPLNERINVCSWATESGCDQECGANSVFEGCANTCQAKKTCRNRNKTDAERCGADINEIDSMCVCEPGYVLDNGNCVLEEDCGCVWDFNGIYYSQGTSFANEDETCECTEEGVVCTPIPCETTGWAYCRSYTDPYIKTFDGYQYGFHGNCRYNLASAPDREDVSGFDLDSKNRKPYLPFRGTVTDELWFDFHGSNYVFKDEKRFSFHVRNLDDSEYYNNARFEVTFIDNQIGETIFDAVSTISSNIYLSTEDYRINLYQSDGDIYNVGVITSNNVYFYFSKYSWSAKLKVNRCYKNVMTGLCGNYNNNDSEERILAIEYADESEDFGDRFQTDDDDTCAHGERLRPCEDLSSAAYDAAADRCDIVDQNPRISENQNFFRGCEFLGNRSPFYEACLFNSCLERDLHCGIIGDFASQCLSRKAKGSADYERICDWASKTGCEEECPESQVFKGCTTACFEQQTCEDVARGHTTEARCADSEELVEGMCGCPDGHVLDEGVCVPENSCGCINIAGAYAAVGSQQHVGSEECTCNEGGEYECVDLGCPCDAFDEECMDFVCAEPRNFDSAEEGYVGAFIPPKEFEISFEWLCEESLTYEGASEVHGPHIIEKARVNVETRSDAIPGVINEGKRKNEGRENAMIPKFWFVYFTVRNRGGFAHSNGGNNHVGRYLEDDACIPGFNVLKFNQVYDSESNKYIMTTILNDIEFLNLEVPYEQFYEIETEMAVYLGSPYLGRSFRNVRPNQKFLHAQPVKTMLHRRNS